MYAAWRRSCRPPSRRSSRRRRRLSKRYPLRAAPCPAQLPHPRAELPPSLSACRSYGPLGPFHRPSAASSRRAVPLARGQRPARRIWAEERQGETAAVVKGQKGLPARSLPSGPCTGRDPRVCLCLVCALLNRIVPLSRMRFLMRRRRRGRRSRARAGLRRVSGLGV